MTRAGGARLRQRVRVVATAAAVCGGLVAGAARVESPALATIGRAAITVEDFSRHLGVLRSLGDYHATLKTLTPRGREAVLTELVDERLFGRAGEEAGVDRDPAVRFDLEQTAARIRARAFVERQRTALAPTDAEAREYFERHTNEFAPVPRVKARQILVGTIEDAQRVRERLLAGEDFATLAREVSTDPVTRDRGGDLGWVQRGVMIADFEQAVFSLRPGEVSHPVRSGLGFHVVRVDEVDAGAAPDFTQARTGVMAAMIETRLARLREELAAKYVVKIDHATLGTLGK